MAASAARPQTRSVCLPCHRGCSVALPLRHLALVLLLSVLVHDAWGQQWKTNLGPCYRDCTLFPEPRLCRFRWTEEIYAVLTGACGNCSAGVVEDCFRDQCVAADGVERTIYTINRQMIGPGIHVCRGDTIRVDLEVKKPGGAETIHWHGLPQRLTPYYDGVAWVTQCPILFGNTFRYEFLAEPAGTYFWHSHSGVNKVNGIEGAMVIRTSDLDNPHRFLYDYDDALHTILLQDWMHVPAEFPLPGLRSRYVQRSDATLVNGQGRFRSTVVNVTTLTPTATFEVLPGFRYRFRIINGGVLSCPIQLQIEDHEMTVIAADGLDIEPVAANTLVTFSGERWDVVVQAKTNPAARAYWILVKTVGPCASASSNGVARLVYDNSDPTPATPDPGLSGTLYDQGTVVNSLLDNPGDCNNPSKVCAAALSALNHDDDLSPSVQPSRQPVLLFFELRFPVVPDAEIFARNNFEHFLTIGTVSLIAMLNNISYTDPSTPLLTQPGQSESCSAGNLPSRCDGKDRCQCAHVVKVPIGSHVDLVFVDVSAQSGNSSNLISHPMHLHGYSFAVMGEDVLTNFTDGVERSKFVRESYNQGRLASYVRYPALKDVFAVPGGGYIWFRFRADNPGCWLFHCHFQYHMYAGMEVVIQVGESHQFLKPPPYFPKCGNWIPRG